MAAVVNICSLAPACAGAFPAPVQLQEIFSIGLLSKKLERRMLSYSKETLSVWLRRSLETDALEFRSKQSVNLITVHGDFHLVPLLPMIV